MTDSCKVNEKALLPQRLKSGLFFKVLCKRKVFNLIRVNEEHQRETYCEGDQGTDVVEIIPENKNIDTDQWGNRFFR